jgi:hypothetical protein
MQFTSASSHLSLVASIVLMANAAPGVIELAKLRMAAAKYDNHDGGKNVAPVDRNAMIAEVIIWTASEPLPVKAKSQPCKNVPSAFQNKASFFFG